MEKLFIVLTIVIYLILLSILIANIYKKNAIIKYAFVIFFVSMLIGIIILDKSIIDNLLYAILRYLYYPTIKSYIFTIVISFIVLVYNVFNEQLKNNIRILNCIFCSLIITSYLIFLIFKIDVDSYKILYSGKSLICLRYASRAFLSWLSIIGIIKYYDFFVNKR